MSDEELSGLPGALFEVAVMLYQQGDEAEFRSTATRAYYAVLSHARAHVVFEQPLVTVYYAH